MGCSGGKTAQTSKPEEKAGATLLQEPSTKPEEPKAEAPAAQDSVTEAAGKEPVADAPAQKTENETPTDANAAKAAEADASQKIPTPSPDSTTTKAEEAQTAAKEPATDTIEENTPVEKVCDAQAPAVEVTQEKAVDGAAADKAVVSEAPVSVIVGAAVPGRQSGCLHYCVGAEAQTEIVVVQN